MRRRVIVGGIVRWVGESQYSRPTGRKESSGAKKSPLPVNPKRDRVVSYIKRTTKVEVTSPILIKALKLTKGQINGYLNAFFKDALIDSGPNTYSIELMRQIIKEKKL